ncbi:MAG: sulfatase-like hydrolase/transferase [Planctomycetota bacterium]
MNIQQLWLMALFLMLGGVKAQGAERANILLVFTDDQGYHDLGCQGATDLNTPNIDRLAASGVRFTDGYVTAPQCGPSRAGLLTGMSQSRFGITDNSVDTGLPAQSVVQTLPEQLKTLGYATGLVGKWHIGYVQETEHPHDTLPGNNPWERGFDYSLKHHGGGAHYFPYRSDGEKWMTSRDREPRLLLKTPGAEPVHLDELPADTYLTDYFSQRGAEFIRRHRDEPWFLFVAFNAPHTPTVAKADKLAKYEHIQDPLRRKLAAMMESVDDGVGLLLNALAETGQTERTLVWYLSDNGGPTTKNASRNDPLSGVKGDMYEGGIRVPFIASWPGTIEAGQTLSDPVISLDILPTSLAAAGQDRTPAIHEGVNLLPWLMGQSDYTARTLYWSWRSVSAIRVGDLKETRNGKTTTAINGASIPRQSFTHLAHNPQELPTEPPLDTESQQMLKARLDAWLAGVENDKPKLTPKK